MWYDFLLPEVAVNTTRDKEKHDQRRRIWDHGFTTKALLQYQDRIVEYAEQLERHIAVAASTGEPVNVSSWFYWFSFDVMGEFAFARSFEMLQNEKWHEAVILLRRAMTLLGPLSPVPWLAQIGFSLIPGLWVVRDWYTMMAWCKERMMERIAMKVDRPDVSSWLIAASVENNSLERDRNWLNGDSIAIIIAGSDTVAPTLVFLFYELALHPDQAEKLHAELLSVDIHDRKSLQALPHLNGFIQETLRLHPPVPSGGYRQTPPEGITVAGQYIPGYTTIVSPRYSLGRLESCFQKPLQFIPERWYSQSDLVKDKRAHAPFSQGRYACVGKNLALAELRFVTALLTRKYRVRFTPNAGPGDEMEPSGKNRHEGEWWRRVETEMRDQFTAAPGQLELVFEAR